MEMSLLQPPLISKDQVKNLPLEMKDDEILTFLRVYVESNIKVEAMEIVRQTKNATVIIASGLNPITVTEAITKLDFTVTRNLLLRLPLYCRPIRDITPKKPNELSPKSPNDSKTGTKPKTTFTSVIPGLPLKAQQQAIDRLKKNEAKNLKKKTPEKVSKTNEPFEKNAFDVLMKMRDNNDKSGDEDPEANHVDLQSSPAPKPNKRLADELDSPNTPTEADLKKLKEASLTNN